MLNRKEMLKAMATLPVIGGLAGTGIVRDAAGTALKAPTYQRDFFTELGVRKFINGRGTITTLTASLLPPEVVEAISYATHHFVPLNDLNLKVGERIAEMLECEAAHVSAGAASAIVLGTAACITGSDRDKMRALPIVEGNRPEVIIQTTHRMGYDRMVRNTGAKFVEVDSAAEMEAAINENTVMAFFFNAAGEHRISHEEFVAIGKRHGVPTMNDAAADTPPRENLFKYTRMGFDLVIFSGGKGIRGPQSAGLLLGRKDLVEAARLNHSPNANIGRGMKVNKEEILAMMVALERFLAIDEEEEHEKWLSWVNRIGDHARQAPSVETEVYMPPVANHVPHLRITWDESRIGATPVDVRRELQQGHPSIEVSGGRDALELNVFMMKPEEIGVVGRCIREVLQSHA